MPRHPDTPCANCGTLLWSSSTSLDPGKRTCRACRAAGLGPQNRSERTCSADGCTHKHYARELCRVHYRQRTPGSLDCCTIDGCERPHLAKGLCHRHYGNARRLIDGYTDAVCPTCHVTYRRDRKARGPGCGPCNSRAKQIERWAPTQQEREARRRDARDRRDARRQKAWPQSRVFFLNCAYCGALFVSRSIKKNCTETCRRKAMRDGLRRHRQRCRDCGTDLGDASTTLSCAPCRRQRLLASRKTDKAQRRAAKRGGLAARFDPVAVFDRDGWKCGICHRKVSQEMKYPHPRSASLDHIVPLSWGGTHTLANTQLAHLSCNMKKNDKAKHVQPLLMG